MLSLTLPGGTHTISVFYSSNITFFIPGMDLYYTQIDPAQPASHTGRRGTVADDLR